MRRIRAKVEFKESPILSDVRRVKQHLMYARSLLTSDIRTKLTEDSTVDLALETEGAGIKKKKCTFSGKWILKKKRNFQKKFAIYAKNWHRRQESTTH